MHLKTGFMKGASDNLQRFMMADVLPYPAAVLLRHGVSERYCVPYPNGRSFRI